MRGDDSQKLLPWRGSHSSPGLSQPLALLKLAVIAEFREANSVGPDDALDLRSGTVAGLQPDHSWRRAQCEAEVHEVLVPGRERKLTREIDRRVVRRVPERDSRQREASGTEILSGMLAKNS